MKVQVVSFTYPPTPGIGGRRWAKFTKYLNRESFDIRVIAAKNQSSVASQWCKDIEEVKNKVTYLDSRYPKHFGFYEPGILHKALYRFSKWKSVVRTKGNFYDKSIHWLYSLKQEVRKNYYQGYKIVVVSVAPFHSALAMAELKSELPDMRLIVDFRDPWTKNRTAYGFDGLSKSRQEFEIEAERKVINSADHVVSVSEEMNDHFKSICTTNTRFSVIPNGFDPEDLPVHDLESNSNALRFVFTGTLYDKSLHQFKVLVNALDKLKNQSYPQYKKMSFDFYGSVPKDALVHFERHEILNFHGRIPLDRVYKEISHASGCMLFLTDDLNYSLSTKFYEYLALEKPILLFAKKGPTSKFIEQNELGVNITRDNALSKLNSLAHDPMNLKLSAINARQVLDSASLESLTKAWIRLLD